jgi:hypothetical protein
MLFLLATSSWIGIIILGIIAFFLWKVFSGDSAED